MSCWSTTGNRVGARWLGATSGANPEIVVADMLSLLDTLHYLHERGLLHRDIKPANAILTDMYEGRTIDDARAYRVLSLFRLEFADPARMLPRVAGKPVYLAMAMTEAKRLRLKPQNLVVNLPLAPAQ